MSPALKRHQLHIYEQQQQCVFIHCNICVMKSHYLSSVVTNQSRSGSVTIAVSAISDKDSRQCDQCHQRWLTLVIIAGQLGTIA